MHIRNRGRRIGAVVAGVALLASGLALTSAGAVPGSTFESTDGNLVVNGGAGANDWASIPAADLHVGVDLATGANDNSFGQGSSEDDAVNTVVTGSIPNSKADLGRFAETHEVLANGHTVMYLAWTRNNDSGSTNFDFEINKAPQPDMTTVGAKTLNRSEGDLLITYALQGGAQNPTLSLRTWNDSAAQEWRDPVELGDNIADGGFNQLVAVANPVLGGVTTIPAARFGEAAIDLTEAGVMPNQNDPNAPCTGFGSAYAKSRSSQSFTSEIKDFIAPVAINLNTCGGIIIKKVTDPASDVTTQFPFTLTGGALNESFNLVGGGQASYTGVSPGTYVAAEGTLPTGWAFDHAECDDSDSTVDAIKVGPLETVTCTFFNDLQVGALRIHKSAKHAAAPTGSKDLAGVVFDVTNSGANALPVADQTTGADGTVCVEGVLASSVAGVGPYTVTEQVPTGYSAVDGEQTYSVVVGTNCTATEGAARPVQLEFNNTPLTDVTVSVDSIIPGGTASTISCVNGAEPPVVVGSGSTDAVTGDGSVTVEDVLPTAPDATLVCTITVDP